MNLWQKLTTTTKLTIVYDIVCLRECEECKFTFQLLVTSWSQMAPSKPLKQLERDSGKLSERE